MSKFISLIILSVFPMVAVFSQEEQSIWEDTKEAIVESSETISNVSSVISDLAKEYGGTTGLVVSAIFGLAAVTFAGVARIKKNSKLSDQDKRELVTQALRATVNAVDAYKESKKSNETTEASSGNEKDEENNK